MKRLLKALAMLLALVIVVVGGYVAYVFISYHRLPDSLALEPGASGSGLMLAADGREYSVVSWNLGFGAYSADFGFFMDGGTESRARSKQAVLDNPGHAFDRLRTEDADFMLLQELDIGSTRSHHVDEAALAIENLPGYSTVFAQNYDSPYLFYPI